MAITIQYTGKGSLVGTDHIETPILNRLIFSYSLNTYGLPPYSSPSRGVQPSGGMLAWDVPP